FLVVAFLGGDQTILQDRVEVGLHVIGREHVVVIVFVDDHRAPQRTIGLLVGVLFLFLVVALTEVVVALLELVSGFELFLVELVGIDVGFGFLFFVSLGLEKLFLGFQLVVISHRLSLSCPARAAILRAFATSSAVNTVTTVTCLATPSKVCAVLVRN